MGWVWRRLLRRVCVTGLTVVARQTKPIDRGGKTYALFAAMCILLLHFAILAYAFAVVWAVTAATQV